MEKLRNLQIFPTKDDREFEQLCLALWKRILGDPNAQLNGRKGQGQHGVDLFGRRDGTLDWVGVQCKVRAGLTLTESDVKTDVEEANGFNPQLSELVFATTAPRDQKLQTFARTLTEQNIRNGSFGVSISFWDDIELELGKESNLDICRRFYQDFFVNYENLGIAVSRILKVCVGVGSTLDTTYDLLLGKTPSPRANSYSGIDYWKGSYFIANWFERRIDLFPLPVYASDLEQVFRAKRDAYIISKWLNTIESIDDLIYGEADNEHVAYISQDEWREFVRSVNETENRGPGEEEDGR